MSILFVPVSGPDGLGEYMRSLAIADAIKAAAPATDIHFVLSKQSPAAQNCPYTCHLLEHSPTKHTPEVIQLLNELRPETVIFDSAGRLKQVKHAKKMGATTVFVTSRPKKRRKGFRPGWLMALDQHWIIEPQAFGKAQLTKWEAVKARLFGNKETVFVDGIFPNADARRGKVIAESFGLTKPFVLAASGGGGWKVGDEFTSDIFARAAAKVATSDTPVLIIMGPQYPNQSPEFPHCVVKHAVSTQELLDLMCAAHISLIGGGSILYQALANKAVCVAASSGAGDQAARVAQCADYGLVKGVLTEEEAMSEALSTLLQDTGIYQTLQKQVNEQGMQSGIEQILGKLQFAPTH